MHESVDNRVAALNGGPVKVHGDIFATLREAAGTGPRVASRVSERFAQRGVGLALLLGFGAGLSYAGAVVTLPPAPEITSFDDLDNA